MPRFKYIAMATSGKKEKGTISAESSYAARKQLRVRGIHPTSVGEISAKEHHISHMTSFKRNKKKQVIEFTNQMSTLLNSGIKLTEALSVMALQADDEKFKNALADIRDRVITGESFTDALKDYSDYFDIVYISMIRVGEVTGNIGDIFASIAKFIAKRQQVESKVVTAMVYPIILVVFSMIAVIVLTTAVIPKIGAQIESTGRELPWITRQLMNFGNIIASWRVFILIAVVAGIIWGFKKFISTPKGAYLKDKFLLWLPVFGPIVKQRVVSRFASTLSILLASGLSMAESLKVVSEVTGNSIMSRAIKQSRERILSGSDITTPLRESGILAPSLAHMVAVGERSGELESMLRHISENLESTTDVVIDRLSAAIEPLIIVFMALVIGLIAYATILPILDVSSV